jgi:putative hemolysin
VGSGPVLGQTAAPSTTSCSTSSYSLLLTTDPRHVRAAQQLRHRVFDAEFGAGATATELDVDRFDAFCDHLVVRENATAEIVGTYRLLPPDAARAAGRLYAEGEFDCAALHRIRGSLVETGRSCVAPGHRSGAVVGLVWAGILRYLLLTGNRWLVGCASVPLTDGGVLASGVWQRVGARHLGPASYRLHPFRPWTPIPVRPDTAPLLPPLLRGYLRLGAWVCGPPAHDPGFGCADFPVLFDLHRLDARYARHLLGAAG